MQEINTQIEIIRLRKYIVWLRYMILLDSCASVTSVLVMIYISSKFFKHTGYVIPGYVFCIYVPMEVDTRVLIGIIMSLRKMSVHTLQRSYTVCLCFCSKKKVNPFRKGT